MTNSGVGEGCGFALAALACNLHHGSGHVSFKALDPMTKRIPAMPSLLETEDNCFFTRTGDDVTVGISDTRVVVVTIGDKGDKDSGLSRGVLTNLEQLDLASTQSTPDFAPFLHRHLQNHPPLNHRGARPPQGVPTTVL